MPREINRKRILKNFIYITVVAKFIAEGAVCVYYNSKAR